jgi:uncharacterized repeat protein (TIGR04076 family)
VSMHELKVTATKVLGRCTANPAVEPGDYFTVRDGDIRLPDGGFICIWALQSMLSVITPKEREIAEEKEDDWMWRVHHVQCPDPNGRVIFKIERTGKIERNTGTPADVVGGRDDWDAGQPEPVVNAEGGLRSLRVVVDEVKGKCTSGMKPGDCFTLHSCRLYIPPDGHFCLYALQAVLPQLPARQRPLPDGDWMAEDFRVICPDPAGNVIMRIEDFPSPKD